MKRILLLLCFISITFVHSQNNTNQITRPSSFWENVRLGGGFGFGFGSDYTALSIAPSAIYEFNDKFAAGLGTSYLYAKDGDLKSNVFGASVLTFFNPIQELQASAEFEQLLGSQKLGNISEDISIPALYLGIAYRTGWASFGIRYDVLYDDQESIFASPWSPIVRFYF